MAWERFAGAVVAVVAVVGLVALLWPLARHRFIYPGGELSVSRADPALHGLDGGEQVWLEAEDGVRLHGWWVPEPGLSTGHGGGPRARNGEAGAVAASPAGVIYFHGNAESIATRAWIAQRLIRLGVGVLLFDYRGYGLSEGRPSEEGLARDARAAWRHMVEVRGLPADRVVLMGQSLGSAVATRLALELGETALSGPGTRPVRPPDRDDTNASKARGPAGLILGSPFPSMPDVFRHHAPWLPRWALRWRSDRHDAGARLDAVGAPVLVLVGTDDALIPPRLSRHVYDAVSPEPTVVTVPADHATLMSHPEVWVRLESFLDAVLGAAGTPDRQ